MNHVVWNSRRERASWLAYEKKKRSGKCQQKKAVYGIACASFTYHIRLGIFISHRLS